MSVKEQIFHGFLIIFLVALYSISGLASLLESIVSLLIYSVITFGMYLFWKRFRKKESLSFLEYMPVFFAKVGSMLFLFVFLLGGFAFYQNEISPANMPLYVITNGKKEVYFQAMVHIGSQSFYKQVKEEIQQAKRQGFVLFFEGVKPGSKESEQAFDEALGAKFDKELYKNFSKLYGLTFQDNSSFLEQVNNLDFNVDLSLDEIVLLYKERVGKVQKGNALSPQVQDIDVQIMEQLAQLNDRELKILVYVNQSLLNFIIKSDGLKDTIMNEFGNQELFQVILGERNKRLAEAISTSKYDKIFVTYGLLHFQGVLDILQKEDSNWKIIRVEPRFPIHP